MSAAVFGAAIIASDPGRRLVLDCGRTQPFLDAMTVLFFSVAVSVS